MRTGYRGQGTGYGDRGRRTGTGTGDGGRGWGQGTGDRDGDGSSQEQPGSDPSLTVPMGVRVLLRRASLALDVPRHLQAQLVVELPLLPHLGCERSVTAFTLMQAMRHVNARVTNITRRTQMITSWKMHERE